MKTYLAIIAIFCVVVCSEAAVKSFGNRIECFRGIQSRIYEGRIKELIEELRDQLKDGIPEKGIPPLDPFQMNNWNFKVKEDFATLNWTMDGVIQGLMSWTVEKVSFSMAGFKFTYEMRFPEIKGKGTYKIDGALFELLPVYGSGEFDAYAQDLVIGGSGKIGSRKDGENQTLFLENFEVQPSLDKFTFAVTGLMEDEQLSFLLSQMISENLPDLIENFKKQIDEVVSAKVTAAADKVLNGLTIQDILDLLKPKPNPEQYAQYIIDCGGY